MKITSIIIVIILFHFKEPQAQTINYLIEFDDTKSGNESLIDKSRIITETEKSLRDNEFELIRDKETDLLLVIGITVQKPDSNSNLYVLSSAIATVKKMVNGSLGVYDNYSPDICFFEKEKVGEVEKYFKKRIKKYVSALRVLNPK